MTTVLPAPLIADLETAGYFPQTAAHSLQLSLRDAEVLAHLVRPETTFDGPEVRRHLTVLVLTRTHLLTSHLDDDPEIGRASCRERARIAGGDGALKKERESQRT